MGRPRRSATAQIRKSVFDPWMPFARQALWLFGGAFEVRHRQGFVGERPEVVPEAIEGFSRGDSAEKFLADRSDDRNPPFLDQGAQFLDR